MRYRYALLCLLLTPQLALAQTFFTARLTADQEPAGAASDGAGTAAFALTDEGLRFFVTVDGLTGDIVNAHIHRSPIGVNGGVVRNLLEHFTGNSASGIWTSSDAQPLTDELLRELWAGNLYVNVHTAQYPGGEIRGQIFPTSGTGLSAVLTPEQEPGDVESEGHGSASLQLTDAGLLYFLTVSDLTGDIVNAHFHHSPPGISGGVVRGILDDFEGNSAFGIWTPEDDQPLTDSMVVELLTGQLYLNVHTAMYPGGEIRGQVEPSGGWGFSAALDPEQEGGNVNSDGTGTGTFLLTDHGLIYHVTFTGLTGPMVNAHFHLGAPGVAGGVVRGLRDDFVGNTASGVWRASDAEPLTPDLIRELFTGNLYVNVHTAMYPPGEIRGQVLLDEGTSMSAVLTPGASGTETDGSGTAALQLTDEGLAFRVTIDSLTGPLVNAHFHHAPLGESGGVVRGILDDFEGNTATGVWTPGDDEALTDSLIFELLRGNLYLNVHTAANPAGEIRGQVHLNGGTSMRAWLTTEQATTDTTLDGSGTATLTLTDAGLLYDITVDGLTGALNNAHFHDGAIGVDGGPVRGILNDFVGNHATGVWRPSDPQALNDEMIRKLLAGDLYLNVHTAANPAGEIRGQVVVSGGFGGAVQLDPEQQSQEIESEGAGTAVLTLTEAGLLYDVTVAGLTGDIVNAHFHGGAPGVDGGVLFGILDDFTGNTATGFWPSTGDDALAGDLLDQLLAGNVYLNVHTAQYPAGEIRGQVNPRSIVATAIERSGDEIPDAFGLEQNYPNPFNPETTIGFSLPSASHARLDVFNVLGQRVATLTDEALPAGHYTIRFDARTLPSGVYLYRLQTAEFTESRTMLLLR